jgi:hypothetical protein
MWKQKHENIFFLAINQNKLFSSSEKAFKWSKHATQMMGQKLQNEVIVFETNVQCFTA